ncbi:ABC transporter ATP-binding protein [Leptothoe spongobia]|uniref:ATP-binding cassette domain-containing protein n=1 Tax=Leptothoe spongobia TAU-MAC 1115 TaxID=1967444 RepID=A0A947DJ73_9CYAN|nr:ATP-binding cassette domain-containing protein [Leptothoe spongobia]MBT9317643.1 ATP-binding cassette domain-containing protein [Leptothoe spongobia TAU-MAC 1115]
MKDDSILDFTEVSLRAGVGIGLLLDQVSFAIAPKTRLAIVGPSGAGKTSLLRLMNRLSEPSSGQITYRQRPLSHYPVVELRRQIGLVMQDSKLLEQSVEETLCYPARLRGVGAASARRTLQPWLERLKIPQDWLGRQAVELSVGQRQRVAIARTLATSPDIVLLDEPTAAQDMGYAHHLLSYLASPDNPSTVMMVNHQLELMADWATHVLYLDQGKLVSYQSISQVDWLVLKQGIINAQNNDEWGDDNW